MPEVYYEQRLRIGEQIRANLWREASEQELDGVIDTLVSIGGPITPAVLSSIGTVVFGNPGALANLDAEALNHIMPALRESRERALNIWPPGWLKRSILALARAA